MELTLIKRPAEQAKWRWQMQQGMVEKLKELGAVWVYCESIGKHYTSPRVAVEKQLQRLYLGKEFRGTVVILFRARAHGFLFCL